MTLSTFLLLWIAGCLTIIASVVVGLWYARQKPAPLADTECHLSQQSDKTAKGRYKLVDAAPDTPGFAAGPWGSAPLPEGGSRRVKILTDPEEAQRDEDERQRMVRSGLLPVKNPSPTEPDIPADGVMPLE